MQSETYWFYVSRGLIVYIHVKKSLSFFRLYVVRNKKQAVKLNALILINEFHFHFFFFLNSHFIMAH